MKRCRICESSFVVGLGTYERCLACHACYSNNERISDTPKPLRLTGEDVMTEILINQIAEDNKEG